MKIIQVIPTLETGGAETMLENLVYELSNMNNEVIVISLYNKETTISKRLEKRHIPIIFLNKKKGIDFSIYKELRNIFEKEKPDIVHTHLYVDKYVIPACRGLNIKKIIHTFHSIAQKENGLLSRIINRMLFKKYNVVSVALSEEVQKTIQKVYKCPHKNIPIIYNGVDINNFDKKDDYSINGDLNICHVGRFVPVKNHISLVKAFYRFHKIHKRSYLNLVGDGELKNTIEDIVNDLKINCYVRFWGLQSDVSKYLSMSDIFVFPSLYEGIPMTLLEAMASGLPIIASNVGGIPDLLTDGVDAILIEPDEDSIFNALTRVYNDKKIRTMIGKNSYKKSKNFSAEHMAIEYLRVYNNEKY